jgi:hypothetical protein
MNMKTTKSKTEPWQLQAIACLQGKYKPGRLPETFEKANETIKSALIEMAKSGEPLPTGALKVALDKYTQVPNRKRPYCAPKGTKR